MLCSTVRRIGFGVGAGVLFTGLAFATVVQRLGFEGLTRLSTNVVAGTVRGDSISLTEVSGAIVTLTTIDVAAEWKGSAGASSLVVRTPGGQIADYVMELAGTPKLQAGDTVLMFLERNADGSYGVVSLAQGSFRITTEYDGSFWVERDPAAAELRVAVGGAQDHVAPLKEPLWAVFAEVEHARALPAPDPDEAAPPAEVPMVDMVEVVKGGGR